jgi:transketolase
MPCVQLFLAQDAAWREAVLPAGVTRRLAIEAGVPDLWHRHVGPEGAVIGLSRFGESGTAKDLFAHFGFTTDNVVKHALALLAT